MEARGFSLREARVKSKTLSFARTIDSRSRIIELTNGSVSDSESNEIPTGGKYDSRCDNRQTLSLTIKHYEGDVGQLRLFCRFCKNRAEMPTGAKCDSRPEQSETYPKGTSNP